MSGLAERAENIAAHLVGFALGATAQKYDEDGRQSVVDFLLDWPDGRRGALEVTLVAQPDSSAWQGLALREPVRRARADVVDSAPSDFVHVVEQWLELPHMPRHVEKARSTPGVSERHLFVVPVDEALPPRFFADDFPAPSRTPEGFAGLDGVWVWSNHWDQVLRWQAGGWEWLELPPRSSLDSGTQT